jgi:hypothetical protein
MTNRAGSQAAAERAAEESRRRLEKMIDDINAQSFPASDPPAWGIVASRLDQAKRAAAHTGDEAGGAP